MIFMKLRHLEDSVCVYKKDIKICFYLRMQDEQSQQVYSFLRALPMSTCLISDIPSHILAWILKHKNTKQSPNKFYNYICLLLG